MTTSLLSQPDFEYLTQIIKQRNGLDLTIDKMYLIESRLIPIAKKWNFPDLTSMIATMRTPAVDQGMINDISDAMTTNETLFFRDLKPFEALQKDILPTLTKARMNRKHLRIWCAAASTGQEPYSIAMTLLEEKAKYPEFTFEIFATDINKDILTRAKEGVYSQFEVQRGLPIQYLVRYFTQEGDRWRLKDSVKNMVIYRVFNLLDDPKPFGQFDIIFCRNVLIYFDLPTKIKIVNHLTCILAQDGYLLLGGAEAMLGISEKFIVPEGMRSIYQLRTPTQKFEPARA
jgi:chemotaxis protein methyltransferase CheR